MVLRSSYCIYNGPYPLDRRASMPDRRYQGWKTVPKWRLRTEDQNRACFSLDRHVWFHTGVLFHDGQGVKYTLGDDFKHFERKIYRLISNLEEFAPRAKNIPVNHSISVFQSRRHVVQSFSKFSLDAAYNQSIHEFTKFVLDLTVPREVFPRNERRLESLTCASVIDPLSVPVFYSTCTSSSRIAPPRLTFSPAATHIFSDPQSERVSVL